MRASQQFDYRGNHTHAASRRRPNLNRPSVHPLRLKNPRIPTAGRSLLGVLAETADRGSHGDRGGGVERVRPARLGLLAAGALPDADSLALHGVLSAKVAEKLGVLGHLLLLHHLAEGSTVTGAVLADDPWWVKGRGSGTMRSACVFIWVRWTNGRRVWGGSRPPCAHGWVAIFLRGWRAG